MDNTNRNLRFPGLIVLVALVTAFFANDGLYPAVRFYDEGVYVVLAKSLSTGSGYVHESLPGSPPETKYPPVLPLLLSLVWHCSPEFPHNLTIMRMVILVSGALFLYIAFIYLRKEFTLTSLEATGALLMVALHPVFINFSTLIASEVPFAFLSIASLYCYSRFTSSDWVVHFVCTLGLATLAAFTRTMGFALLIALIVHLIVIRRFKLCMVVALCTVFNGLMWGLWTRLGGVAYMGYPSQIAINYVDYFGYLGQTDWIYQLHLMLPVNFSGLIKYWTSILFPWEHYLFGMPAIIVVGTYFYVRGQLRTPAVHDIFVLLTLIVIVFWPWPVNNRFLLTISPFLISFQFNGIRHLVHMIFGRQMPTQKVTRLYKVSIFLVVLSATTYNLNYTRDERENQRELTFVYTEFHETLEWVRNNTPKDAILVGDSDPAYYLFTGRKSYRLSYPDPSFLYYAPNLMPSAAAVNELRSWLLKSRACYLVYEAPNLGPWGTYQAQLLDAFKSTDTDSVRLIYTSKNRWFEVYQFDHCPRSDQQ